MEIIYPENFIKFFNDDDIDDVGEYEIFFDDDFEIFDNDNDDDDDDDDFDLDDIPFIYYNPKRSYSNYDLYSTREHLPIDYQMSTWQNPYTSTPACGNRRRPRPNNSFNIPGFQLPINIPGNMPGSQLPIGLPPPYIPSKNDKGVQNLNFGISESGINPTNVSAKSIRFCLFKFTFIWQKNGRNYWSYLIHADRRSVAGFRWVGWRWVYFGVDLRKIDSFICY